MKKTLPAIILLLISTNLFGQTKAIDLIWQQIADCIESLYVQDSIQINKELIDCIKKDSISFYELYTQQEGKKFEVVLLLVESHYSWIEGQENEALKLLKIAQEKYIKETKGLFKRKKRKIYLRKFSIDKATFNQIEELFRKPKYYPPPPINPVCITNCTKA